MVGEKILAVKESNDSSNRSCFYSPADYLFEKFALVTIFGTAICLIGIFNNALLVLLLARKSSLSSPVFYLAILAGCDIIVEFSYILLMSAQILYDYTENVSLYFAWNNYLRPVFAVSHVTMIVSTYMIVAASAERYLVSINWMKGQCGPGGRILTAVGVLCFAVLSRGMVYWELDVVHNPNCTGFETYHVRPSSLAAFPGPYKYIYMLWFRHVAHVFLPFVLLICLNVGVVVRLQKSAIAAESRLLDARCEKSSERKKRVRAATRMLIAMVITYLISNLLNVIITIWEHLDMESLRTQGPFYAFSADTVSLLTVINSAIRLPIYCACNKQLARELMDLMDNFCGKMKLKNGDQNGRIRNGNTR